MNPNEDFADKWHDSEYARLNLEGNFHSWLKQARADFQNIQIITEKPARPWCK
ncbi:MAG: hypothetical protein ABI254_07290 [Chthoniobacterales bacterium]